MAVGEGDGEGEEEVVAEEGEVAGEGGEEVEGEEAFTRRRLSRIRGRNSKPSCRVLHIKYRVAPCRYWLQSHRWKVLKGWKRVTVARRVLYRYRYSLLGGVTAMPLISTLVYRYFGIVVSGDNSFAQCFIKNLPTGIPQGRLEICSLITHESRSLTPHAYASPPEVPAPAAPWP